MRSNFQAWLDDADMPQRDAQGNWFDAEDGLPYDPTIDYCQLSRPRRAVSARAVEARALAKLFGGKALTGTAKQKEWAEKIRAEKLAGMTDDQAVLACDSAGLGRSAHFWIEARNRTPNEIGKFFITQKAMLARAKALRSAGKAEEYAAAANEYNALTTAWGFTA